MKELIEIQSALNAPKERRNEFGKYNYRSAEDILKAVKPLLKQHGCVLLLSDEVKEIGSAYTYNTHESDSKAGKETTSAYNGTRIYVEATATIINSAGDKISVCGLAREEVAKKGMDAAQITGAASSYARKYALNGLFAIDDSADADSINDKPSVDKTVLLTAKDAIVQANTKEDLTRIYNSYTALHTCREFMEALTARRKMLGIKKTSEL